MSEFTPEELALAEKIASDTAGLTLSHIHRKAKLVATPSKTAAVIRATQTIDITPTWGEWGNIYRSIAERSDQGKALKHLAPDLARALASCQALNAIRGTLTPAQEGTVAHVLAEELLKQGY